MTRTKQIQGQIDRALEATRDESWIVAEANFLKALTASRGRNDWQGMIEIVEGLRVARRGIRRKALVRGTVRILDESVTETMDFSPGRYLVQPPLVGADARRLIQFSRERNIPLAVVCREPRTRAGLVPIVAIAPGTTIRDQIEPPANEAKPTTAWFKGALEAIGEAALETIDPSEEVTRRVDRIIGCLDAIPDNEPLHVKLAETCEEAAQNAV